jgi:hypothetical protein
MMCPDAKSRGFHPAPSCWAEEKSTGPWKDRFQASFSASAALYPIQSFRRLPNKFFRVGVRQSGRGD